MSNLIRYKDKIVNLNSVTHIGVSNNILIFSVTHDCAGYEHWIFDNKDQAIVAKNTIIKNHFIEIKIIK
jgi:hypothetical protein